MEGLPQLDPKRKHTVEAVVDRLRLRPDVQQRLAESFETALRLSGGLARLTFLDEPQRAELVFSSRHACPICGYSVPPLEPKLFSFNNPAGACPTCDGLGTQQFFDPQRVVTHPDLSLASGAVRGWDRRNSHYFQLIQSLARHYRFDIEVPWTELPERVRQVLLYGSGDEAIEFRYNEGQSEGKRRATVKRHPFEGILPNLERRYRETESTTVREELGEVSGRAHLSRLRRRAPQSGGALRVRRRQGSSRSHAPERRPRAGALPCAHPRRVGAARSQLRSSRKSSSGCDSSPTSACNI